MIKFLLLWRFSAYTAYTVATKGVYTVAALLSKGVGTVATLMVRRIAPLSQLKNAFYSRVGGNSVGSFPNFAQEHENEGLSQYELDEFDHEDFDEWWDENGDDEGEYEDWGDGYGGYAWDSEGDDDDLDPVEEVVSWTKRAVDEAIDEEQDDHLFEFYDEPSDDNQS